MNSWLPILVALAVGLTVLGLGLGALWLSAALARERMEQRLNLSAGAQPRPGGRVLQNLADRGQVIDSWFDEGGESEILFRQAGWRRTQDRLLYYAVQAALPMLVGAALLLSWLSAGCGGWRWALYGFGLLAAALLAPRFVLRSRAQRRRNSIRNEVPMFIHLLALLFDAGLSLRQALVSLVRDGGNVLPELGTEVRSVLRQLEAGGEPAAVLHAMGQGLDVAELTSVVAVLRQVDRYGGELREPLMESLAVVEERRQLAMREKVNSLSGRMTIVMVLFFFPALLVFVAGPAALAIFRALGVVD